MNPLPHQLASAPTSMPSLDLNVDATEEPIEVAPPAMAPPPQPARPPYTVEQIFLEFSYQRAALIRAITTGSESMYLYGHTDGSWEVREPELFVPPELPEPTLGINKVRDMMERVKWLQQIAKHCDSWLVNVSFFMGAKLLNANGRERLFTLIHSLRTVYEAFLDSDTYRRLCHEEETRSRAAVEDEEIENDDDNLCGLCGFRYHGNGFWIFCDVCKGWFHGRCVKITEEQAKHTEHYVCTECCSEKNGHVYE